MELDQAVDDVACDGPDEGNDEPSLGWTEQEARWGRHAWSGFIDAELDRCVKPTGRRRAVMTGKAMAARTIARATNCCTVARPCAKTTNRPSGGPTRKRPAGEPTRAARAGAQTLKPDKERGYSHAALHVAHGIAVEANDPGVVPIFLPAVSYEANTKVHVRRARGLTPDQQSQLVDFVWELLYRPYSTRGAIATVWQKLRQQSDRGYFCSQLAAAAYESIKAPIADPEAVLCKPSDLNDSERLVNVPDAVQSVKKEVGAFGEKFLIDVCLKNLPKEFAQPFNIYDLLRQFFDGTVDVETVGNSGFDPAANSLHRGIDVGEGFWPRRDGQIGEININRKPRKVANKQIDRRPAFEGKTRFFRDQGKNADEQGDLPFVDISERHSDPQGLLYDRWGRGRRL
jgi:hypothetical protein